MTAALTAEQAAALAALTPQQQEALAAFARLTDPRPRAEQVAAAVAAVEAAASTLATLGYPDTATAIVVQMEDVDPDDPETDDPDDLDATENAVERHLADYALTMVEDEGGAYSMATEALFAMIVNAVDLYRRSIGDSVAGTLQSVAENLAPTP